MHQRSRSSGRPGSRRGVTPPTARLPRSQAPVQARQRRHRNRLRAGPPRPLPRSCRIRAYHHDRIRFEPRPPRRTIMTTVTETAAELFAQILDPANRPDPYPLYARLREAPVAPLADGFFAVSRYAEIAALLHDPRMSKDQRKTEIPLVGVQRLEPRPFHFLDPPEHDRLRRLVMDQFTPARVNALHDRIVALVDGLLDAHRDQSRLDVVDDLAYPLPVTVICELLGVPREDESRFHAWADTLAHSLDPDPDQKTGPGALHAGLELRDYMQKLVTERRAHPRDDLLSGLAVNEDSTGGMDDANLVVTMILLLIAGHETTVNLITNGMLTLLRNPDILDRLRHEPELAIPLVAELLRYEPPVQFIARFALADIESGG